MERVEVRDTDGAMVRVYPSSGVLIVGPHEEHEGPFVWLMIEPPGAPDAYAHLTRAQATQLRDALTAFIEEGA